MAGVLLGIALDKGSTEDYLLSRMHVGPDSRPAGASAVGLEFDYAEAGQIHRYHVTRRWVRKGSKAIETLALEKDGKPIASVPQDEWHHFLQELIPPGVSQLFFFDGEKIAEIARDDIDEGLADAVRGLLGIELVGRLRTDLGLFLARRSNREDGDTATRLEQAVRLETELDGRIAEMTEHVAELTSRRAGQARVAANLRQRFSAEGGDAASKRASLEATRDELRQQIVRRETELRDLAGGLLPFAVAPKLVSNLIEALSRPTPPGGREAASLRERILAWRADGNPPRQASWKETHWRDLDAFLAACETEGMQGQPLGDLELGERSAFLDRLRQVQESIRARAGLIASELDQVGRRLQTVEAELVRASGKGSGVILDELILAEQQVGAMEAELRAREEELRGLEFQRAATKRERERLLRTQEESEAAEGRAALAGRIGRVLQQYEERLLETKLAQLQREFVHRFNHLARKEGFVADARIDRVTFATTLIDRNGREIPKAELSAGEKQVYAIAMLWALARTSGRALPMIIDTPLARLDSEHRAALVERYFPEASHQVIVLSTDTEVDNGLLRRLTPAVSHMYQLDYDPKTRSTTVRPGYFGEEQASHAL